MRITWILAADAARARIFEIPGARRPMREIRDFFNPEGRAQNRELDTLKSLNKLNRMGLFRASAMNSAGATRVREDPPMKDE